MRDVLGRLAFTSAQELSQATLDLLEAEVAARLGSYARPHSMVVSGTSGGQPATILGAPEALCVDVCGIAVRLIDRRLSGADWLRQPRICGDGPPTVVFVSMKGGVGRSTGLAVCALDLVRGGRRVLVLDLAVEAPGLGVMLLTDAELPPFGVLDALMERKLGVLDDAFVQDLVAPSRLGNGGLLVCPALGERSLSNPAGVLSKMGRIYGEAEGPQGERLTVLDQVSELVERLVQVHAPDVVLVDARAGLHELTAATVLGLGSEVLLFGLDEPQTWQAYRILLTQLKAAARGASWMDALTPVQGKVPADASLREEFWQKWRDLLGDVAGQDHSPLVPAETLPGNQYEWDETVNVEEDLREVSGVAVLYNATFVGFNPLGSGFDRIDSAVVHATFGDLIEHVRYIVGVG